jgi:hypothetical protein
MTSTGAATSSNGSVASSTTRHGRSSGACELAAGSRPSTAGKAAIAHTSHRAWPGAAPTHAARAQGPRRRHRPRRHRGDPVPSRPRHSGDAVLDVADNCPRLANANQANLDGDALGDVCDPDDDGDGVADVADNCPRNANANQANADGDPQGDACDPDDDNDGGLISDAK